MATRFLEKWDFPQELRIIPKASVDFSRQLDKADYADLVTVALLQYVAGSDHPYTELDWTQITAFKRLGIDPNFTEDEDEDLNAEMEAAMALLS